MDKYIDEVKGIFDDLNLSGKNSETSSPPIKMKEYGRLIESGNDVIKTEWLSTAHSVSSVDKI